MPQNQDLLVDLPWYQRINLNTSDELNPAIIKFFRQCRKQGLHDLPKTIENQWLNREYKVYRVASY